MPAFSTKTIDELTETLIDYRGKTPQKTESGIKLITAKVIKDGFILDGNHEFIAEDNYDDWMQRGLPKQWDILITTEAPLGEVAQLRTSEKVALAQRVILLRGKPNLIDQQFYFQALKSPFAQAELQARGTGTTVLGIKQSELRQVRVPYYQLPTQQKIASILSAYDDLIENNTRRIKILYEMAQAIYRHWFIDFKFPGHKKVKLVDSPLGKIPERWEVKTFGETSLNFDRKRKPLSSMIRQNRKGPYPYYGAAKVFDYIDDFIFDGEYLLMAEDGSVITPDRKPVLQLTKGKFWANNHTHILQGKPPISTEFLYLRLSDLDIQGYVTGAAQPKITQENMNRIPMLVPSEELLGLFDNIVRTMFIQMKVFEDKNNNLRWMRDLLLPKLISGEVDVSKLEIESMS